MSNYDRERARRAMQEHDLVALMAQSPESVQYHTGESGFFNRMLRNGYAAASIDFADPGLPPAMVVSNFEVDPIRSEVVVEDVRTYMTWIAIDDASEISSGAPVERPVQPPAEAFCAEIDGILRDRGVQSGRIGVEANAMSATIWKLFGERLSNVSLVPLDTVFSYLRAIKSPAEIETLRVAALLTEAGIEDTVRAGVTGATHQDLWLRFQENVIKSARAANIQGVTSANPINFNIGPDPFPVAGTPQRGGQPSDIVKLDAGVTVKGYRSDLGRTCVLGDATPLQQRLARALLNGLDATLAAIRPGEPLRNAFSAGIGTVRAEGFTRYSRGHLGHAIGLAAREDYPFISDRDNTIAQPGMALAVEVPYYVSNLGAMLFEENIVVTADGWELLTERKGTFDILDH